MKNYLSKNNRIIKEIVIKVKEKIGKTISTVIYIFILLPLIIALVRIAYQKVFYPEMIPDIFGYKMFVIFDENMDESLKYGDLVITYNKNLNDIKNSELIAYRNNFNTVTILPKENNTDRFEGAVVNRIPKLGSIMYYISKPIVIIIISCMILLIGGIWIFVAKKIDEKEYKKIKLKTVVNKQVENSKKIKDEQQKKEQKDLKMI